VRLAISNTTILFNLALPNGRVEELLIAAALAPKGMNENNLLFGFISRGEQWESWWKDELASSLSGLVALAAAQRSAKRERTPTNHPFSFSSLVGSSCLLFSCVGYGLGHQPMLRTMETSKDKKKSPSFASLKKKWNNSSLFSSSYWRGEKSETPQQPRREKKSGRAALTRKATKPSIKRNNKKTQRNHKLCLWVEAAPTTANPINQPSKRKTKSCLFFVGGVELDLACCWWIDLNDIITVFIGSNPLSPSIKILMELMKW